MTDLAVHVSAGLCAGIAWGLCAAARMRARDAAWTRMTGTVLLAAGASMLWALGPALLRRLDVPETVCTGNWTNVFWGHAWIQHQVEGGRLIGMAILITGFAMLYTALVSLLWVLRRRRRERSKPMHGR
jgi:hypothetical protein